MKQNNFKIFELSEHQVLISKDFDNEVEEDTYQIIISFFNNGVKADIKLNYSIEEKRDEIFNSITAEQLQQTVNNTIKQM